MKWNLNFKGNEEISLHFSSPSIYLFIAYYLAYVACLASLPIHWPKQISTPLPTHSGLHPPISSLHTAMVYFLLFQIWKWIHLETNCWVIWEVACLRVCLYSNNVSGIAFVITIALLSMDMLLYRKEMWFSLVWLLVLLLQLHGDEMM